MARGRRFRFEVTLLEDLHTGSGTGGALVDAMQKRDRLGRPVIRETHYKGVLRAAAEELVSLKLASAEDVETLFGEKLGGVPGQQGRGGKGRGALIRQSLYLREQPDGAPSCLVWSSTAREPGWRHPQKETLRSREFIPAGSVFEGQVLLRDGGSQSMLEDCIRRMRALGAERNRGAGAVRVAWEPLEQRRSEPCVSLSGAGRVRLRLVLRNLDPLCLPVTGNAGNIIPTECHIRGQALLGALADWARETGADVGLLFRYEQNDVSIGNAYPLPEGMEAELGRGRLPDWELLPIPLQLKNPKPAAQGDLRWPWWAGSSGATDYLEGVFDDLNPDSPEPDEKPKRPKDHEFLFREAPDQPWRRFAPRILMHLRNQVPETRTEEDDGELFSMEEIAEDTRFVAELEFANLDTARAFAVAFAPVIQDGDWLSVGRGGRPVVVEHHCWIPMGEMVTGQEGSERGRGEQGEMSPPEEWDCSFLLLLQSDLLARSTRAVKRGGRFLRLPNLEWCDVLDPELLLELAGFAESGGPDPDSWEWKAVCDTVEVRGFNAASGLPRAPARAIRRGSAIRISGKGARALLDRLRTLPCLGSRGREGFGRFRLFEGAFPIPTQALGIGIPTQALGIGLSEGILGDARKLADQILGEKIHPSRSQWMQLRTGARASADRNELKKMLERFGKHSETIGGSRWTKYILDRIKKRVNGYLGAGDNNGEPGHDEGLGRARLFIDLLVRWIVSDERMTKRGPA